MPRKKVNIASLGLTSLTLLILHPLPSLQPFRQALLCPLQLHGPTSPARPVDQLHLLLTCYPFKPNPLLPLPLQSSPCDLLLPPSRQLIHYLPSPARILHMVPRVSSAARIQPVQVKSRHLQLPLTTPPLLHTSLCTFLQPRKIPSPSQVHQRKTQCLMRV